MKTPGALGRLASKVGFPATTIATSSQSPPTTLDLPTFTPFPRLPTELRNAIWRAALPRNLHITEVCIYNKSITPRLSNYTVFWVNRESRAEAFAALSSAPPPYSLPDDPERDIISLSPMTWNDLPHMPVGKAPVYAAVSEIDHAQRFVAATLVDSVRGRFDSVSVEMRFYTPYGHASLLSSGPRDFQGRPLKMDFFRVARKMGVESRGLGASFYANSVDGEDGVVGLGGRKDQGAKKPVLRVVYVL